MKILAAGASTLLLLCLLKPSLATAQSSTKTPASTPKPTAASTKCHALLVEFQGKEQSYFAQKTDEELNAHANVAHYLELFYAE